MRKIRISVIGISAVTLIILAVLITPIPLPIKGRVAISIIGMMMIFFCVMIGFDEE